MIAADPMGALESALTEAAYQCHSLMHDAKLIHAEIEQAARRAEYGEGAERAAMWRVLASKIQDANDALALALVEMREGA